MKNKTKKKNTDWEVFFLLTEADLNIASLPTPTSLVRAVQVCTTTTGLGMIYQDCILPLPQKPTFNLCEPRMKSKKGRVQLLERIVFLLSLKDQY